MNHEDLCGCGVTGTEPVDCAPDCICNESPFNKTKEAADG